MSTLSIGAMLAQRLNISTEDNAQVEVNFNIDTDEDAAPSVDETIDVSPEAVEEDTATAADVVESEGEANVAEADMDQLQEAQDSLESLGVVLNEHARQGTLTPMGISFYRIALESIVGQERLSQLGVPSLESHSYTKYHAISVSLESHIEVTKQMQTISMEATLDWLRKIAHKIDVFFRSEKALLKRAKALNALADGSTGEHSSNTNLKVNTSKSPNLHKLLTVKWSTPEAFLGQVKEFCGVYNAMTTVKGGFDDEFVDNLFPGSAKWIKNADGKPTKTIFGVKLVRDPTIICHRAADVESETSVPNLSPAMCKAVLKEVITLLEHGDIMHENAWTMLRIMEKSKKVTNSKSTTNDNADERVSTTIHEKVEYAEGHEAMFETMQVVYELKNKVVTEILNYVNFSLTDRDFI